MCLWYLNIIINPDCTSFFLSFKSVNNIFFIQGELRKLNREDKEKCNELVNEGGTSVLNQLEALGSVHMKFLYSSNDFFSSSSVSPFGDSKPQIDGDIPILSLEKEGE